MEMRKVLASSLEELMQKNENIVLIDADLSKPNGLSDLKNKFPDRAFDIGISEQNMASIAAGMSSYGFIPFISTFTPFASRRICDQIAISCAYAKQNVKIIATDPGISAEYNGGTHMSFEDIGVLRSIPEIVILEPVDSIQLKKLLPQITEYREYYVELYASNRYETSVMMEPGAYRFTGGGPETDDFAVFDVISPKAFTVKYKEGLIVEPVIRSNGNIIQETVGIRTSEAAEREAEQNSLYEALGFEVTGTEAEPEEAEIMPDRGEMTWVDNLKISLILFALATAAGIALLVYNKLKKD